MALCPVKSSLLQRQPLWSIRACVDILDAKFKPGNLTIWSSGTPEGGFGDALRKLPKAYGSRLDVDKHVWLSTLRLRPESRKGRGTPAATCAWNRRGSRQIRLNS